MAQSHHYPASMQQSHYQYHSQMQHENKNNNDQQQQQQLMRQQQQHHHHEKKKKSSSSSSSSSSRRRPSTRVFATGYNYNYQFGIDSNDNYSSEIIELEWCRGLNISYICSGLTHLCYLSFTGNYYFCGQIDREKLGIISCSNTNNNKKKTMITMSVAAPLHSMMDDIDNNSSDKIRVSRIADGVSSRHIIIISTEYRAYSMGANQRGQLALGHFKSTTLFNEIHIKRSSKDIDNFVYFDIIDASGGESHSAFVVMPKCKSPTNAIIKVWFSRYMLDDGIIIGLINKYLISSSSLLTEPRGRLYVCGCNNFGQLGIGDIDSNNNNKCINKCYRVIGGGLNAVSIAQVTCGENHTVCLDNRGRVYCFGDNYYGQSGAHLNHYENVYYPLKIEYFKKQYQAKIVKVSSGKYHCVALDKIGRVFCWGLGAYGQLGCNKLNKRIILPIMVEIPDNDITMKVVDVRCGIYHTAAITNKGNLYCWGSNNYGQCFQNVNHENIITPKLAKIDKINEENLLIYKVFCGYYSTLILTHDPSS